jgi:predicted dehydrogenase
VRLSVIGLETTHGWIYPAMINGYDPAKLAANALDIVSGIFPTGGAPSVSGGTIVACYHEVPALAHSVSEACLIERVCPDLADAYRDVDGVIIASGQAELHRAFATPALEAGLPVFVDKPFTYTVEDAEALAELSARTGTPIFCTSATRFADQSVALKERLPRTVGTPLAAHVIGNGDYANYAVHSLEFMLSTWGGGVSDLLSIGAEGYDTIRLNFQDGRRAIWQICKEMIWGFDLNVFGTEGVDGTSIRFEDRYQVFKNTAARIVQFMADRQPPVPLSETLEIVRLLEAVPRTRGTMETVTL